MTHLSLFYFRIYRNTLIVSFFTLLILCLPFSTHAGVFDQGMEIERAGLEAERRSNERLDSPSRGASSLNKSRLNTIAKPSYTEQVNISGKIGINLLIVNIIKVVLGFLGIIFLVIIIYSGFTWATAGGNQDKVADAKKWLTNGIIGLAIVVAAYMITAFVLQGIQKSIVEYDFE